MVHLSGGVLKDYWKLLILGLSPIFLYVFIFTEYWRFIRPFKWYIPLPYALLGLYLLPLVLIESSRLNHKINNKNKDILVRKIKQEFEVKETVICNLDSNKLFSCVSWDKKSDTYKISLRSHDSKISTLIHEFCHIKTGQAKKAQSMDKKRLKGQLYNFFADIFSCYWREMYYLLKWGNL